MLDKLGSTLVIFHPTTLSSLSQPRQRQTPITLLQEEQEQIGLQI